MDRSSPIRSCRQALLAVLLVLALACGEGAGVREGEGYSRTDSAGIEIVESRFGDRGGEPVATIGHPIPLEVTDATGRAVPLYRVIGAVRLGNGRIVVAHGSTRELLLVSPAGEVMTVIGGNGEGPGEFRALGSLHRVEGDSVFVHDPLLARVSVYSGDLTLARTFSVPPLASRVEPGSWPGLVAALTWSSEGTPDSPTGVIQKPSPISRLGPAGSVRDTAALVAGDEFVTLEEGMDAVPLFPRMLQVETWQGRIYAGNGDRFEIRVLGASGLEALWRLDGLDLSLSESDVDRERELRRGPAPSALVDRIVSALPSPRSRAAYSRVLADTGGDLWVERYYGLADGDDPHRWEIFGSSGVWLGGVSLPARFMPTDIGDDYILGVARDDLDREEIQTLPLSRSHLDDEWLSMTSGPR